MMVPNPLYHVLGDGVVQVTSSLTLIDVLYVSKFPIGLFISQFTKQNSIFPSHCVFRTYQFEHERRGIYYLDDRVSPTDFVQVSLPCSTLTLAFGLSFHAKDSDYSFYLVFHFSV